MHSARQSFFILLQLFKHQNAESDGAARLAALPQLTTTIAFRFLVFEKL